VRTTSTASRPPPTVAPASTPATAPRCGCISWR
jgi:hypothetical protein